MTYYEDSTGASLRWREEWVKVLPVPNRYPQDMEFLELQQSVLSRLVVHHTAYEIVMGLKATCSGNELIISEGTIWCGIGEGLYIQLPRTQIRVPTVHSGKVALGIQLIKEVVRAGYDPILGGVPPTLWEAPMDRVRVYARYLWDVRDTLPVLTLLNGKIHYYSDKVHELRDSIIRTYIRDLDGDYIAYGINICLHEGWVHIGSGRAWIAGTPVDVEAQSIPYRSGELQLCTDGAAAIESSHETYVPEYSAIVSNNGTPILIGGKSYGVVLPNISLNPYLIPLRCVPLATLSNGVVTDIAARLPTDDELLLLLHRPLKSISSDQIGDVNHPLYRVRVSTEGVIYLPRTTSTVQVEGYVLPNTRSVLEESSVRTDWIDSAPTPSTPPPPPPFVHAKKVISGYRVRGYNLSPSTIYTPYPAPDSVTRGALTGTSITSDAYGMLEYISSTVPIDLSGIVLTATPNVGIGLGQSFKVSVPVMVGTVSLYLRAGYYGVISICPLQNNQPYGAALAWVGVSTTSTGWTDVEIGPIHLPTGTYGLISQSVIGSVIGRRHYLLPTLEGVPETTNSMSLMLSQAGTWESLPNMDLMYRIYKATPNSTYGERVTTITGLEAFDGYEYTPNYNSPPNTYITCTGRTSATGALIGSTFPPRTSIALVEALFGTATLFPTIGEGSLSMHTTSKTGTWVSLEALVGAYTAVIVLLDAVMPEGSSVSVYVNSGAGWLEVPLLDIRGTQHTYRIEDMSPTTSSTDINGVVKAVVRERIRVRVDLSTTSPEIQPRVWNIARTIAS
jgi:hypothetical protein